MINDVCGTAHESNTTISRSINKSPPITLKTINTVHPTIFDLSQAPSHLPQTITANASNCIGLIISHFHGEYFNTLIEVATSTVEAAGKKLLIVNGGNNAEQEEEAINQLVSCNVDAITLYTRSIASRRIATLIDSLPVPLIVMNQKVASHPNHTIAFDHYQAAYGVVEKLIQLKHTNIACIAGPEKSSTASTRLKGYHQALIDYGIKNSYVVHGNFSIGSGYDATSQLLIENPSISAIFACNDSMARGAMRALAELHRPIPSSVSLYGFNDDPANEFSIPRLSSVALPIDTMAKQTMQQALNLANRVKTAPMPLLQGKLMDRESIDQYKKAI